MSKTAIFAFVFATALCTVGAVHFECHDTTCEACQTLDFGPIKGTGCAIADVIPDPLELKAMLTWNNETLWQDTIDESHPKPICEKLPVKEINADLCLQFTNLNFDVANKQLDGCADMSGLIDNAEIFNFKIGCFHVPL